MVGSNERQFLKYTGKIIIVLPWKSPLDDVLESHGRDHPMDVLSLSRQFIEGVDFLHRHGVAHCDLKPGNVVVDTPASPSPELFIIDFDLAEWVEGVKTMMKGWWGTRPWVAPDLGSRDDPQLYSPILADRWACGRMIHHFLKYIPAFEFQTLQDFVRRLLNVNPEARPELNELIIELITTASQASGHATHAQ